MPPFAPSITPLEPLSPRARQRKLENSRVELQNTIRFLNETWNLEVVAPKPDESPQHRERERTREQACGFHINYICLRGSIGDVRKEFDPLARDLYTRWVRKPKAERGVIPQKSREVPHPVSDTERAQLLELLLDVLKKHRSKIPSTPSSRRFQSQVDDRPIPSPFPHHDVSAESKRGRNHEESNERGNLKKARISDEFLPPPPPPKALWKPFVATSPSVSFASLANTSIISNAPSIFSQSSSASGSVLNNTQETVPDELPCNSAAFLQRQPEKAESSDYASSSFERQLVGLNETDYITQTAVVDSDPYIEKDLSQGIDLVGIVDSSPESILKQKLSHVFPDLPVSLRSASLRVIYEICRVFLHTGTSMADVNFPHYAAFENYNTLWKFLKRLPILKDKSFPERCAEEVWGSASDSYSKGSRGLVLSGCLAFAADTLWKFTLNPMKLDLSHRLGRRFGHDRFLEIDIPLLEGRQIPRLLADLEDQGREIICNWLVDPGYRGTAAGHKILGKTWQPFFLKRKSRDKSRKKKMKAGEEEEKANRLYMFAVHPGAGRLNMKVAELLDHIRPISANSNQSFLKLFSRTTLALSRNQPTIVFQRTEIYYITDLEGELDDNGGRKVMTDGAGRISPAAAVKIKNLMALSFVPSGFQGRIGEAKGLWTVDYKSLRPGIWIELYASQCKWEREEQIDHPWQRTFEVIEYSCPLKSAELNAQFLPLIMDCAINPTEMRESLFAKMDEGLEAELEALQTAQEHPMSFRKWIRDQNPNIDEKLRHGEVPYRAGMPARNDECLNVMLDAGYSSQNLLYFKRLAKRAFRSSCDVLKEKLNIKLKRSTYVYMAPDFSGILDENEVFLGLSKPIDDSGIANRYLDNVEVLVARSPAHYPSDIQRVKAVVKVELLGYEDVILFSTKGKVSLADKLSGGDFDGDRAWVCWEPEIVRNFQNANVPKVPNLEELGILQKDRRTYKELVDGQGGLVAQTALFLKESFMFNMRPSMLGICTNHKELVSYTHVFQDRAKSKQALDEIVLLSTLLSNLVDQSKQGYIFGEEGWTLLKSMLGTKPRMALYKNKGADILDGTSKHIIDQLKFRAGEKIETSLTSLHKSIPDPPSLDPELGAYYRMAKELEIKESADAAAATKPWKVLLNDVREDLEKFSDVWTVGISKRHVQLNRSFGSGEEPKESSDYMVNVDKFHARYHAIQPRSQTLVSQILLFGHPTMHIWDLLKASTLYELYAKKHGDLLWLLAGRQLCALKVLSKGTHLPAITPGMQAMQRPDAGFVKRFLSKIGSEAIVWDEDRSVVNADEIEDGEDV